MARLTLVPASDTPARGAPPDRGTRLRWTALALFGLVAAVTVGLLLLWWFSTADSREIQALPDEQRLPLYRRTLENLKMICDPAATRALSDFCYQQADLVLKFRECEGDARCQELAHRHLGQPRR